MMSCPACDGMTQPHQTEEDRTSAPCSKVSHLLTQQRDHLSCLAYNLPSLQLTLLHCMLRLLLEVRSLIEN